MDTFKQLREIAAKKRDDAIDRAKADYRAAIEQIAKLETDLRPRQPRGTKKRKIRLVDLIHDNLPTDRAFSFADVTGILESIPNARSYAKGSINMTISRLLKAGDIKRVRYAGHGKSALYALPDVNIDGEKTMLEWAREVDGWRDMDPVELMVKMTEAGYEMEVEPSKAVASLDREVGKLRQPPLLR